MEKPVAGPALKEFSQKVCRYFLDFLETDFKRQQAPRRRIQLKTDTGFRSGMALRKYPRLSDEVWALCNLTVAKGLTPAAAAQALHRAHQPDPARSDPSACRHTAHSEFCRSPLGHRRLFERHPRKGC